MADQFWRVREDLVYRKLADGGMLYDNLQQRVHHLNATAAFVWENCCQRRSSAEIVEQLCASFEVERSRAELDVGAILRQFTHAELLQS